MIDHTGIQVSDYEASKAFYTLVLATLGYELRKEVDGQACGFGVPSGHGKSLDPAGEFWIVKGTPYKGMHIAFSAETRGRVDAFHREALAAGGKDNGAPGPRPQYHEHYYGAFAFDPDGYNIEAVCHKAD
jgi:catechol 2,3-dioxygenase-like lactoylglutathione lyase family enzyme